MSFVIHIDYVQKAKNNLSGTQRIILRSLNMTKRQERGDRIIAFAVMIQSLLLALQTLMMGFFHMNADATTIYRVVLTAIPMIAAMVITWVRKPVRVIAAYTVSVVLLVLTIAFFPKNTPFVISQGIRFLLPVVIPSFLCLTVVYDYKIVEQTLYIVSWLVMFLVSFYIIGIFTGVVSITSYNMAFSFACVLPFVSFYSHRKFYDQIVCFVLFIMVIAIGARGAALCMASYVVFDLFQHKSRWRFLLFLIIVLFIVSLPLLNNWLQSIGIRSRSLNMLLYGNFIAGTGRLEIRQYFVNQLIEHPLWGIGLFGDRLLEGVVYCHNIILEILLDFGILFGGLFLSVGLIKLVSLYFNSNTENRNRLIGYFCGLVLPFMTSDSYLIGSGFAIFVGLCYLLNKERKVSNDKLT